MKSVVLLSHYFVLVRFRMGLLRVMQNNIIIINFIFKQFLRVELVKRQWQIDSSDIDILLSWNKIWFLLVPTGLHSIWSDVSMEIFYNLCSEEVICLTMWCVTKTWFVLQRDVSRRFAGDVGCLTTFCSGCRMSHEVLQWMYNNEHGRLCIWDKTCNIRYIVIFILVRVSAFLNEHE